MAFRFLPEGFFRRGEAARFAVMLRRRRLAAGRHLRVQYREFESGGRMPETFSAATSPAADKKTLRTIMRRQRDALAEEEAARLSLAAQKHILTSSAWQKARSVALYFAVGRETNTRLLLEAAWNGGKEVLLPHTATLPKGQMLFLPCAAKKDLTEGLLGIPEPAIPPGARSGGRIPNLIIVPGLAFDRRGYRLGQGGGYYDRFFADPAMADAPRIGLAYAFQILDSIATEAWDTRISALATEEGLLWL